MNAPRRLLLDPRRLVALILALAIPLVAGRVVYTCVLSGVSSFHCCCAVDEVAEAAEAPSCCCPTPTEERDACTCCDVSVFTIDGMVPSAPTLDADDGALPPLVWWDEPGLAPEREEVGVREPRAPPGGPPLYILHVTFLV